MVSDWQSAPRQVSASPFPVEMQRHGKRYRQIYLLPISNPFYYSFPRQLIGFALPPGAQSDRLVLVSSTEPDVDQPFQICEQRMVFLRICQRSPSGGLPCMSPWQKRHREHIVPKNLELCLELGGRTAVIDTGRARFRLAAGDFTNDATAPLLAVSADDGSCVARVAFAFLMALPLPGESQM